MLESDPSQLRLPIQGLTLPTVGALPRNHRIHCNRNLRLDQKTVAVRLRGELVDTGLRKFGAIIGERAEVGCNAVLNPGTLLGPRSLVMPTVAFAGYLPPATLARNRSTVALVPRRE